MMIYSMNENTASIGGEREKKKKKIFVLLIQFAYLHKVQADQALICYGYTLSTHFK